MGEDGYAYTHKTGGRRSSLEKVTIYEQTGCSTTAFVTAFLKVCSSELILKLVLSCRVEREHLIDSKTTDSNIT